MVNEINKPQIDTTDNVELGERLAASNRALAEMQAEHRQLVEEMEHLRRRAEELQRMREQQEKEEEESNAAQLQQNQTVTTSSEESTEETKEEPASNETASAEEPETKADVKPDNEDEDPAEADYIKQKLSEIANLKAQFRRVQTMINTTEMIEQHIAKKSTSSSEKEEELEKTAALLDTVNAFEMNAASEDPTTVTPSPPATNEMENATNSEPQLDEKQQLLNTMLDMFQNLNMDLRGQADNLRAERERIRLLKEDILRQRQQPPK